MILFGKPLKDHLPSTRQSLTVIPEWKDIRAARETAMADRFAKSVEYTADHRRDLPPLSIRDHVLIQNQYGPHPNRWEKTGEVVETLPNRQYTVKTHGSNRITMRNRKFLRKYSPTTTTLPSLMDFSIPHVIIPDLNARPKNPGNTPVANNMLPSQPLTNNIYRDVTTEAQDTPSIPPDIPNEDIGSPCDNITAPPPTTDNNTPVIIQRRSNRHRRPRRALSPSLTGKYHKVT